MQKPDHVPAHKMPAWLSSEDIRAEIVKLAEEGADKAVCWDMMRVIDRLCERSYANREPEADRADGVRA